MPLGEPGRRNSGRTENAEVQQAARVSFAELHQRVLEQYAPPSVIVNRDTDLVHISDRAGRYLRFVAGEPSDNLLNVVLPELRLELRTALYKAVQTNKSVEARRVQINREGHTSFVNMIVRPFRDADAGMDFALVLFDEVEDTMSADQRADSGEGADPALTQLESELLRTKEDLQATIEQSETSTEELKAANEELQAINEELRSTTEELETSKEELQSMNEELNTVNYELKGKVDETTKINDDLQNLIASTDIATLFVDREMTIRRYTPGAAQIFNLIPSDIGRSLFDITHRLKYAELAEDAEAAFTRLATIDREVHSSDGHWYIARLSPYRTVEDRIEGTVLAFIDITTRKLAEERLLAEEEHMRLVAESTRDYAIFTMDLGGTIKSWNTGAERVFGWPEAEAIGQHFEMIFVPEDRQRGAPAAELQRAREQGRAEDERWHLRKDGSRFYCSGVTNPIYRDGVLHGYAKIGRDWTRHKQMEESREAQMRRERLTVAEAQAENSLKDEFMAVMSHELKNPLHLIQLNAEILSRLPEVNQSTYAKKAAQTIRQTVVSQSRIIDDLLDLSRIRTGKLKIERVACDFASIINGIVETMRVADKAASKREVSISGTAEPMLIEADSVRVEQMVGNLLGNALKFTGPGDRIDISLSRDNACARLDIRDSGQGISAEILPRVFDMFSQGDNYTTRAKGGFGIGLSLVKQLAELHDGRVQAHSDGIGRGTQFTLWLPLQEAPSLSQSMPVSHGCELKGLRILMVDDAEEALGAFKELLQIEGAQVATASSAKGALALCESADFDLILSDIGMPDVDGYELISRIKAQQKYADVPVLALSGFTRPNDVEHALRAGFAAYLSKPLSLQILIDTIKKHAAPRG